VGSFSALAADKVTHTPPEGKYIPGFRIQLDVEIQESTDLLAARCYFKTKQDQNFAFTDLFNQGGGKFKAVLPAPWINSKAVEYLFVAVDKDKQVTRTPLFVLEEGQTKEATAWQDASQVKEVRLDTMQEAIEDIEAIHRQLKNNYRDRLPEYQSTDSADSLMVQTELSKEVMPLNGFYDKAVVTEVADNAKYGFMADGLYTPEQIAAAEAAGVPTAKTGMSTAAKVGIGIVAVAAIAAGVAVAASGSSSDDHGGGGTDVTSRNVTICVIDHNNIQDDYYDLYVNNTYIGHVNNPPGGTTCHDATLNAGANKIELRLTKEMERGTDLTITVNPGGWTRTFQGSHNHDWTITAP
jgi:hypothetical protein